MVSEVLSYLDPKPGETIVDCTVGGGGHARRIWERMQETGRLIGFDQDKDALAKAREVLGGEAVLVQENFRSLEQVLAELAPEGVDGVFFDLGVSSPQLDWGERGFSYNIDAPLDMRMNQDSPLTAEEIVNTYSQRELTKIIASYGEERWASRIAKFIVEARQRKRIETTGQLVELIRCHPGRGQA